MKMIPLFLILTLMSCSHQRTQRTIASTTPLVKTLITTVAKELKIEASVVSARLLNQLKLHPEEFGLNARMVKAWNSLDDIPVDLRRSLNYEFVTRAPKIFKFNQTQAQKILNDVKIGGHQISKLQESFFMSQANSRFRVMGRDFEKNLILSAYKTPELKKAMGETFDNLISNAVDAQGVSIAKQIMKHDAELYAKTGETLIMSKACKDVGGLDVHSTMNKIMASMDDEISVNAKLTYTERYENWTSTHMKETNRDLMESKAAFCVLTGRAVASNTGKACRVFNPKFFGDAVDCSK